MTISRVGFAIADGDTLTMPSHQEGDLLLAITYRHDSVILLSRTGWLRGQGSTGNTNSLTINYRIAQSSSETFGTWTGATQVAAIVYRHSTNYLIVGGAISAGTTTDTINYAAVLAGATNEQEFNQWYVGLSGYRANNTSAIAAPTNMTTLGNVQGSSAGSLQVHDTNGLVGSWSVQTVSGSSLTAWRSIVLELVVSNIAKSAAPPAAPPTLRGGFGN